MHSDHALLDAYHMKPCNVTAKQPRTANGSKTTLAISHVWSHGQGGRPEQNPINKSQGGMNLCLHQRYSTLAKEMDCDSYWMDTPCIPQDHGLRREAIEQINPVFENSKATLICDRDLMDLDIGKFTCLKQLEGPTTENIYTIPYDTSVIHLLETLLVVLLAARGRQNIHILCPRNEIISLHEALSIVSLYGAIEIAILYLTAEHLNNPRTLLSRRHASRDGDITIIWSLMFGNTPYETPELMWRSLMKMPRQTSFGCGFLMTNTPRLSNVKGLSWAPQYPALMSMADENLGGKHAHLSESESAINVCMMQEEGLSWWCCAHRFKCGPDSRNTGQLEIIRKSFLTDSDRGALLFVGSSLPVSLKGNNGGTLADWRGVYEWDDEEPFPRLIPQHFYIQ
ncbi:hypothetical protein F4806DRAFT_507962 [Annulohypoxylon nitens]|nr:hypothetical protein F4806DRAFT_507962 [Annulohypoxylon nitens]